MAASPFQWGHQIAWLISFLALPVLVGATVLLLVVLPALDTLSAGQVALSLLHCSPHVLLPVLVKSWHGEELSALSAARLGVGPADATSTDQRCQCSGSESPLLCKSGLQSFHPQGNW